MAQPANTISTGAAPPPPIPAVFEGAGPSRPRFASALRGIWLLTWKSQLTWRKVPGIAFSLLVLPVLIYLTTPSQETWTRSHFRFGNPSLMAMDYVERLARAGNPLTHAQKQLVRQIFIEEFRKASELDAESDAPQSTVTNPDENLDKARACFGHIRERLKAELSEDHARPFAAFEREQLSRIRERASQPQWNRSAPFYHWLIDIYFFLVLPLMCVAASGALIREELQANTLGFLTTRPLTRASLLVSKYLAQMGWRQIILLVQTLLLFAAGAARGVPSLGGLLPLFLAAQLLAVPAWTGLGVFMGLVAKRYLALALLYGFIVEMGIGRIPTNINNLSIMRHLKTILAHNPALETVYEWTTTGSVMAVLAPMLAAALFVAIAAALFTFKEYHHTTEMQK